MIKLVSSAHLVKIIYNNMGFPQVGDIVNIEIPIRAPTQQLLAWKNDITIILEEQDLPIPRGKRYYLQSMVDSKRYIGELYTPLNTRCSIGCEWIDDK